MVEGFADDRIPAAVTDGDLVGTTYQEVEGKAGRAALADLGKVPALEEHHNQDVGLRIPACLSASPTQTG